MWQEFKKFALKGNIFDMAVGIIVGAAFSPIVKSFVDDVLMPPIGLLLGGVDFTDMFLVLKQGAAAAGPYATLAAAKEAGAVTINVGTFINTVINFLIIGWAVFMLVKGAAKMEKKEEEKPAAPPAPPEDVVLLREIRDALKAK
ncbi:MAG: large conductance mechanosensitive channel protein MscL [Calditrichaeota bacterium]|nr:large conductance mechanosensitive channel protein MscL [Calditrichota bacterium]MCB0267865.1 large conductance mechanosensitive channel protein MscL [Calditrichota bacterium]MCB0286233.1 large conductance mechanosensitive channel protein MscL [Calditrichota bacterium]MCB0299091.1 large conductance mechanosensitive channel protein MscL [Calditrichota bacterium]MCB9068615.1 large conductance mechanosensitive channel protein MscL [Calditrichia bacterium]